ncbi:MAG TPA: serine hydrolase domain-containing protein [Terriglobales bacterium]|nr:serine hydrolase domain-containing protein [Terriglobales bacterium]
MGSKPLTVLRHAARITLFIFLPALSSALAQQVAETDLASQIDAVATQLLKQQHIPAMTVALASGGQLVYSKGFGIADLENAVPANADTLIRTGSIAKSITAVAAMTLVEAGQLELDAPIQRYCPAFPKKEWTITTHQLLTHTSGIRHYKEGEIDSTRHYDTMAAGFAIFAADPLLFEPGTRFNYSTYAYTVVGCVIEGASGEKYFDYVREHVLVPAGMTHTFVDDLFAIVPLRARGYQFVQGKVENAGLMDSSYKIPGGGLVSTAADLVRLAMALMDGKILKPGSLAAMWTPTDLPDFKDGKPSEYGMGFGVNMVDGQQRISHSGGQQGTSTYMAFFPAKRLAVAVMANNEQAEPDDVVGPILSLYHLPQSDLGK